MAGYAMAGCPDDVSWQRVVNSRGMISLRADGRPDLRQRRILEAEGIAFDERGRIDLATYGWFPPG